MATLQVGLDKTYKTPKEAITAAVDGDIIEVDAGTYETSAVFVAILKELTIKGVGGRAIFDGKGQTPTAYSGQAIMPVDAKGKLTQFENIEFWNGRGTGNTAGVKVNPEANVKFYNCVFRGCQNGILGSAGPHTVEMYYCEFANNGNNDGQTHNVYLNNEKVIMHGCWSHDSVGGQLIKSRAKETLVSYSRFDGRANYEMDFSSGGDVTVIGCLVKQVPITGSDNKAIINYGREGLLWPVNRIRIAYSTFINEQDLARFLVCQQDSVITGTLENSIVQSATGFSVFTDCPNWTQPGSQVATSGLVNSDFTLPTNSPAIGSAVTSPTGLLPTLQYKHPYSVEARSVITDIGALTSGSITPPPTDTFLWGVTNGSLPIGLTMSADGKIRGIPTTAGTSVFTVTAVSSKPNTTPGSKQFTLVVKDVTIPPSQVVITTPSLPDGTVGQSYSADLTAIV